MKTFKRITERLIIRPMQAKDFEQFKIANLNATKKKNKWDLPPKSPKELNVQKFEKLIQWKKDMRKQDRRQDFAVFLKSGELVGEFSIMEIIRGLGQSAFIGYHIYNNYWGQGFAKEALKATLDIAFKDLKLHRIEAGIEPKNLRSIRLAKSFGMKKEGLKRKALYLRKNWVDLAIYSLTTEDLGLTYDLKKIEPKYRNF